MRALIGVLAVLTTGCYLAGYGSAPLETNDASLNEAGMGSEPALDAGMDASLFKPIDASEPDAPSPFDAAPDAPNAPDASPQEPSDADTDADMDADTAVVDQGMDAA